MSLSKTRLRRPAAFAAVAAVIATALYASATPSALYATYQARWHFSTPVLTAVYATYAVGVLAALLLAGGLSDRVGRRPVLAVALFALLACMAVFAAARSVTWLFAARALQGLATGAALSAATAALLDLHPRGDARRVALVNGVVNLAGLGIGAFASALLVQLAPAPRVVPFGVVAVSLLALLGLMWALPEPVTRRRGARLRPTRPAVPPAIRGPFALAALLATATFSLAGVYLALGPELATQLLHAHGALAGGTAVAALLVPGALAQIAGEDLPVRTLAVAGGGILTVGGALLALSAGLRDTVPFFCSTVLAAVGIGLGFMGALRHLTAAIPSHQRAEVMAAFYIVGYLALSLPAVAAGFAARSLGAADTFALFGAVVALVAAAVTVGGLRIDSERVVTA